MSEQCIILKRVQEIHDKALRRIDAMQGGDEWRVKTRGISTHATITLAEHLIAAERDRDAARDALQELVEKVDEWCEAVSSDASWDGWDSHYKGLKYGGLDKARALLAAQEVK